MLPQALPRLQKHLHQTPVVQGKWHSFQ
ncbi:unnamed protein product [Linum tenue]|uniref:Uncharacterized protein n=1 Tax=Linum tenue TaxID=586396 RepID=A0AAV0LRF9_9ROSI|nr:unnamed protein product [Linum tenue]CAI0437143.1 unnamed protein product [Linum tenue]